MTQVANVDYGLKRIYCHADTVASGFDIIAAYFEINVLRYNNVNNAQNYYHMLSAEGNIAKGGGTFTPKYGLLQSGWRVVPYDQVSHTLNVLSEPVSLDGLSGRDVFDRSGILLNIDIDEMYEKIEIREVNTGSAVTAQNVTDIAAATANTAFTATSQGLDLSMMTLLSRILDAQESSAPPAGVFTLLSGQNIAIQNKVDELHKLEGLDAATPMTVTPTSRNAGTISQTISGDGETTSTVTRTA